jgi:four helix bundle protein
MHDYNKLKIWENSIDLVVEIYELTKAFPKEEIYGLSSQMRRSAVSIPSNIAEGCGRNSNKEFLNFLSFSSGSTAELDTQLIIASRLSFLTNEKYNVLKEKLNTIQRMNFKLREKIII